MTVGVLMHVHKPVYTHIDTHGRTHKWTHAYMRTRTYAHVFKDCLTFHSCVHICWVSA